LKGDFFPFILKCAEKDYAATISALIFMFIILTWWHHISL